MKIDLSKYPPGTKFIQNCNSGTEFTLIGKSFLSDFYILEYKSNLSETICFVQYLQDGRFPSDTIDAAQYNLLKPVNLEKYRVAFQTKNGEMDSRIVDLLPNCTIREMYNELYRQHTFIQEARPFEVLSWCKIEE